MSDNKFWAIVWAYPTFFLVVLAVVLLQHSMHQNEAMVDMVEAGADPIAVRCAFAYSDSNELCLTYILTDKENED